MNYQKGMVSAFTFITILATLSYLPVYLLSISAEMMLAFKEEKKFNFKIFIKKSILPLLAFELLSPIIVKNSHIKSFLCC